MTNRHGDHQHDADHLGIVALLDRAHEIAREPRPVEHEFDQHGAAEQRAHMQGEHGHDRDQRIAHDVVQHDPARVQSLGVGGAHVVAPSTSSTEERVMRKTTAPRPMAIVLAGISSRMRCCNGSRQNGTKPPAGTQRSFCAKIRIGERADHEHRDREPDARRARQHAIDACRRRAAPRACRAAGRTATAIRLAGEDQLERARQAQRDLGCHRMIVEQRTAEIACAAEPRM